MYRDLTPEPIPDKVSLEVLLKALNKRNGMELEYQDRLYLVELRKELATRLSQLTEQEIQNFWGQ